MSPPEWFCIKAGSCVSHFNVSLIVWAKSRDNVHKPQLLKREESRSGSNRGPSAYQPSALPLGHTGSHELRTKLSKKVMASVRLWLEVASELQSNRMACRKRVGLVIERLRVQVPAGAAGEFNSPELNFCADSYSVSVPPRVSRQWHVKDPAHSAKSACGRLHLNTHTPMTQRRRRGLTTLSRFRVEIYQGNELTRNSSSGNTRPQSSQLSEPPWTDPDLLGGFEERFDDSSHALFFFFFFTSGDQLTLTSYTL